MVINYGMILVGGLLTKESQISGKGPANLFIFLWLHVYSYLKNNEVIHLFKN